MWKAVIISLENMLLRFIIPKSCFIHPIVVHIPHSLKLKLKPLEKSTFWCSQLWTWLFTLNLFFRQVHVRVFRFSTRNHLAEFRFDYFIARLMASNPSMIIVIWYFSFSVWNETNARMSAVRLEQLRIARKTVRWATTMILLLLLQWGACNWINVRHAWLVCLAKTLRTCSYVAYRAWNKIFTG